MPDQRCCKEWIFLKACKIICMLCFFIGAAIGIHHAEAAEPMLRIGLWEKQTNVMLSANAPFILKDSASRSALGKYPAQTKIFVSWKNGTLFIDNKPVKATGIEMEYETEKKDAAGVFEVNRKTYRGKITLKTANAGLTVINTLPVETYLDGVVAGEMPDDWPAEALKAQAVAARTFALYNIGRHESEGFDLCASTHCQVYGGAGMEQPHAVAAVKATRGEVLTYGGKLITALFHTSSGGQTENSEDVWGSYFPYLRSVKDSDQEAPFYRWTVKYTAADIEKRLQAAGISVGKLQAIGISPLKDNAPAAFDRSAAGRVKKLQFIGTQGSTEMSGDRVRAILGLKSTYFDVEMLVPADKKIDVPIGPYYKKEIAVDLPPYKEKGLYTDPASLHRISGRPEEYISFEGRGWGHGLGLSQWGAKAMAKTMTCQQILQHYYTGAEIKTNY